MVGLLKSFLFKSLYHLKEFAYTVKLKHQYRNVITDKLKNKSRVLNKNQITEIGEYYQKFGIKNVKTYWHEFCFSSNNLYSVKYVPEDLFHAVISRRFNQMRQWPTLLDKNLLGTLFLDCKQPDTVVKNINGLYYIEGKMVSETVAIEKVTNENNKMVIKPSIDSGNGQNVVSFLIKGNQTSHKGLTVKQLLRKYQKDFIVQNVVNQHENLKSLNPSSLNTIRVMSYLNANGVHDLSAVVRIGASGSFTDNFEDGGIACGIDEKGRLKKEGYLFNGKTINTTNTGIPLENIEIPSFNLIIEHIKKMHLKIPYFRFVSWDIGVDTSGNPILIEYNTYHQGVTIHQLANGPLFGDFTEEILKQIT